MDLEREEKSCKEMARQVEHNYYAEEKRSNDLDGQLLQVKKEVDLLQAKKDDLTVQNEGLSATLQENIVRVD